MSVPPRLSSKLNDVLGSDAAGDLVTWIDEMRADREAMRADFAELRQEIRASEARLADRMHQMETGLRTDMNALGTALRSEIHAVDIKVGQSYAGLIKWSFVFWVTAVASIAVLAGVLRR